MWGNRKYWLLNLILIVGIFLIGIKVSGFVSASETDKTAILTNLKKVIEQDGTEIPDGGQIDPNEEKISVRVEFGVPVKHEYPGSPESMYVVKGDTASIEIGQGIKLNPSNTPVTVVVMDVATKKKIGTATFKNKTANPDDGIVMDFVFDGEDDVFENYRDVKVNVVGNFDLDISNIAPIPGDTSQTVTVLGKTYNLKPIKDKVFIEKKGEVDYLNSNSVKWTIKVKREALGQDIGLEGYEIKDELIKTRKYVQGSFKVAGVPGAEPIFAANGNELGYTIPAGVNSPAVIEFNTEMSIDEFLKGYKTKNIVHLYKGADKLKTAEADLDWKPKFGRKTAKKYGEEYYEKIGNDYFIDWEIVFNEEPYNLTGVTIKDVLRNGKFDKVGQQFIEAKLERWDGTDWIADPVITAEPAGSIYHVGNISNKVRLTIRTKVTEIIPNALGSYNNIKNRAIIQWAGNATGVEFWAEFGIGPRGIEKSATLKNDNNNGYYVDFDTEWIGRIMPNSQFSSSDFYLYDCMIFDNTVSMDGLRDGSIPFTVKDQSNHDTTLETAIDMKKLVPYQNKYLKYSGWGNNPDNLIHKVYKMYAGTDHIGDIIEIKGFNNSQTEKTFSFKTKQTALGVLMKSEGTYNVLYLVQDNRIVESASLWPKYNSKLLNKQAFTTEAARDLTAGGVTAYSADKVNKDIFDTVSDKGKDNTDNAYDKDDKSVLYRIIVNAAGINGIVEQTGAASLNDELPAGWEFADVRAGEKFLIYEGESYTDAASPDATVRAIGNPVNLNASDFNAVINPNKAEFTFNNIDKPYVILLKAKLRDTTKYINQKEEMINTALLSMKDHILKSEQRVSIDERFLTKEYDASAITNGYLTWKIEYKPYPFLNPSADISLEDELGEGIELRRYKNNGKLVFKDDNYRILVGSHNANGDFVQEGEPLTNAEMEAMLTYTPAATSGKLTVKLPDKTKSYQISYVTDIKGKVAGQELKNTVKVKEGNTDIQASTTEEYIISSEYGSGSMRPYNWLKIVKKNKEGEKLKDAEFELTPSGSTVGTKLKTDNEGTLEFTHLLEGKYKLKEVTAPVGYIRDTREYEVTVSALTVGFDVDMDTQGNAKVTRDKNIITLENEKISTVSGGGGLLSASAVPKETPEITKVNTEGETLSKPTKPVKKSKPKKSTKPKKTEKAAVPAPREKYLSYHLNKTPDPNNQYSPGKISVIGDNGISLGIFIKKTGTDGTKEYVLEDNGKPLGDFKASKNAPALPRTGGKETAGYYIVGVCFILTAGWTLKKCKYF